MVIDSVVFAGCSFASGEGFYEHRREPNLWVNLLHQRLFPTAELINVSISGRSNSGIFQDAVRALTTYRPAIMIVEWTSMPRYELHLGLEPFNTFQHFIANAPTRDHVLHDITYTAEYLDNIRDRFISLAHPHHEITKVVDYVNSLIKLGEISGTQVFFVNGLCPWDQDFFNYSPGIDPDTYTLYTKELLCASTRPTEETIFLYEKMHAKYIELGSIQSQHWLNLYKSLLSERVDFNDDGAHPGIKSNSNYANFLCEAFESRMQDK